MKGRLDRMSKLFDGLSNKIERMGLQNEMVRGNMDRMNQ